ncbi:MAG: histidinol-phosphate transaminase [Eubacteriales bacterium]|nr:histidinol-phosphate transaminase [Eubacteriales bacterium]MDD3882350.1 histidinol-phosphate transaminase [Eubacteriales bacterium]MDD4512429.1 histidinol-phosphate transaminase [Eubacteriales bacterium]
MYLSSLAQGLTPYVAGEQPKNQVFIKLNTNENPYPPSPMAEKVLHESNLSLLRLYPDTDASAFCKSAAEQSGVKPTQIFAGNGSDEVLAFAFAAFFAEEKLFCPDITYSFYPVYSELFRVDYRAVPVREDFSVCVDDLMQGGCVALANPNAPTGLAVPVSELRRLAEYTHSVGKVLLIDEAYAAFNTENAVSLVNEFDNVLITRTMSKSHSLAGLRLGYAIGSETLIDGMNRVKNCFNSYTIDMLGIAVGKAAIDDREYCDNNVRKIVEAREYTEKALRSIGMTVLPSRTNFVFAAYKGLSGAALQAALRSKGFLVRNFQNGARIRDYLRITIGTMEQMEKLAAALEEIIKESV